MQPRKPMKRRRRPTGPDRKTRALMYDRDRDTCLSCGEVDLRDRDLVPNHRVNRGMGGSTAPWINDLTNLHTACRGCNSRYEDDPAYAYANGWKVRSGQNPASVPICYPDGSWWLLQLDGTRTPAERPRIDDGSPVAWTITRPYDDHDGPCPETCGAEPLRTGAEDCDECFVNAADASYIAAMHPAVALAVAELLDRVADDTTNGRGVVGGQLRAVHALADAFLGSL